MEAIKKHSDTELAISTTQDMIVDVGQLKSEKEGLKKTIEESQVALDRVNFLLGEAKKLKID